MQVTSIHEETKSITPEDISGGLSVGSKLVGRQSLEESDVREGKAEISILIGKNLVLILALFKRLGRCLFCSGQPLP